MRKIGAYLFGPFRLDVSRRLLYRGSTPTSVPERLFQVLLTLIEAGDVVPREFLADRVWGSRGVSDTNLSQYIYLLRHLLGQRKGERSYIVTIPGVGYRFVAPVRTIAPQPKDDEDELTRYAIRSRQKPAESDNELLAYYCRGSYHLDRRTAPSLQVAVASFEEALRIDAHYVPALLGLARAHALLAEDWHVPPAPAFNKAKSVVARALRLESRSATARALLSELHLYADWDWVRAGRGARSAIALNPQSTFARNNAARYYCCRGDADRAMGEAMQALMVDPASLPLQLLRARILIHAGDYPKGIAALSDLLGTDADYHVARRYRAQAFVLAGRYTDAIEDLGGLPSSPSEDLGIRLPLLARAYAGIGDARRALGIYDDLQSRARNEYVPFFNFALVASGLGRFDEALGFLESALQNREPPMLFLRTLPWFRPIERWPEFATLLRQIGPSSSL